MSWKWVILVACLVGVVLSIVSLPYLNERSQRVDGVGGIQPLDDVLKRVRLTTPLRVVTSTDTTRFLPIRHVIFGRDGNGRELVVWGRIDAERYVYLDDLKVRSREDAEVAARAAGFDLHTVRFTTLSYFDRGSRPIVWHIGTEMDNVYVDATTGSIAR